MCTAVMLTQLLYQGYYMQEYHWPERDLLLPYKLYYGSQKGSVTNYSPIYTIQNLNKINCQTEQLEKIT